MGNQFQSLDEDDIEFLDSVMESSRSKEAEVKKDTRAQLEAFRKQQEDAEKAAQQGEAAVEVAEVAPTWSVGPRKRKREQKTGLGAVKLRRTSTAEREARSATSKTSLKPAEQSKAQTKQLFGVPSDDGTKQTPPKASVDTSESAKASTEKASLPAASALGLIAYSSDEDE